MASIAGPLTPRGQSTRCASADFSSDPTRQSRRRWLAKTARCRFFSRPGGCGKGATCQFAHGDRELRSRPDLRKTALCMLWAEGRCPYDDKDCAHAHGADQLQAVRKHDEDSSPSRSASNASGADGCAGDDQKILMPNSNLVGAGSLDAKIVAAVFAPARSEIIGGGLPLDPSRLRKTQSQTLSQKECLRCQDACAMPVSARFCTNFGFMLVGTRLYRPQEDSQITTSLWTTERTESNESITTSLGTTERTESNESSGYNSDDDMFFERRDISHATYNQSQQVEELARGKGGLPTGVPLA